MPRYKAILTGDGAINNSYIYLEVVPESPLAMPIFFKPKGIDRKTWTIEEVSVEVDNLLDYDFRIHAIRGTAWKLKLSNVDNNKDIIDIKGETGEKPEIGLNLSKKTGQVSPDGAIDKEDKLEIIIV